MELPKSRQYCVPFDAIRQRPGMYLGPDIIQAIIYSSCEDIFLSGGRDLTVFRDDKYVIIAADKDWMICDQDPFDLLFQNAVTEIDDRRVASHWRVEAFVAALAAAYFTDGPAGQSSANMSFGDIPEKYRERIAGKTRYLIFDIRSPYFQPVTQEAQ